MNTTLLTDGAIDAIGHEHHELQRLYAKIRATLDVRGGRVESVRDLFVVLTRRVREHFENEEKGGYFREILELAPRFSNEADRLQREHAELLDVAEQLAENIHHAQDSEIWRKAIQSDFEAFLCRCERHEAAETRLVQDAYLQDIGAMD
ncbi:MAG: hemerythrin domain-containing protein [Planctomycetaceae bacterium]